MTTAYTSLLGLALPVTGELSGTWGDTVNNSITSLLDSAIAGTTTLSSDTDVTLTTTTGAANTSRQAILLWTAGGTVTRNITAPAQSKIYTVINASSSTQSIVLRGVGPTTGVTIVKGESAVCAWNGSDFIKISNTGGAAVFTTLDVTNLEVTNIKALDGTSAASIANSTGVISLTANPILSGGTANGVAYLNGSKVLTTGSALVFDGTKLGIGVASPSQYLSVSGTDGSNNVASFTRASGSTMYAYVDTGANIGFFTGSNASGSGFYANATDNNLKFMTNSAEKMRLDSSGNLGIGITSPAYKLDVERTGSGIVARMGTASNVKLHVYTDSGSAYLASDSGLANSLQLVNSVNTMVFNTNGVAKARISSDAYGVFTVGTQDSVGRLGTDYGTLGAWGPSGGGFRIYRGTGAGTSTALIYADGTGFFINEQEALPITFTINGSERARFDSSGNLLVGSSSTIGTGGRFQVTSSVDTSLFKCTSSTTYAAIVSNVENTAARLMAFQYGSGGSPTNVGTITTNGTGVTYGTSSDYRLKENIAPMIGALDKVAQLKPVTYKWKANGSDGQGFIAHELKEVVSDAVQGEKDAVDEDGNPVYQGIDTSYLVATLTAAIQEQQALITQLTARITALEGA